MGPEETKVTMEELQDISDQIDAAVPKFNPEDYRPETPEKGETKVINVQINPDTGENQITDATELSMGGSFEEDALETITNFNFDAEETMFDEISDKEFTEVLLEDNELFKELTQGLTLSPENIRTLIEVVNARIKDKYYNCYKAFPDFFKEAVKNYVTSNGAVGIPKVKIQSLRREVADAMVDSYIKDIRAARGKKDFANQLANIYVESYEEIEEASKKDEDNRNKKYREITEGLEDSDRKKRMMQILDNIDEAKNLTQLKEFAKHCRIKKIELEKPEKRVYNVFLNKYKDSVNNIYDIDIARKALGRNINRRNKEWYKNYDEDDINSFFIAFCKQVKNYSDKNINHHVYMYYVLYNCVLTDTHESTTFLNNVREVIDNIRK